MFHNYNEHVGYQSHALQQTIALTRFEYTKIISLSELH